MAQLEAILFDRGGVITAMRHGSMSRLPISGSVNG